MVQRPGISFFSLIWSFSWCLSLNVGGRSLLRYGAFGKAGGSDHTTKWTNIFMIGKHLHRSQMVLRAVPAGESHREFLLLLLEHRPLLSRRKRCSLAAGRTVSGRAVFRQLSCCWCQGRSVGTALAHPLAPLPLWNRFSASEWFCCVSLPGHWHLSVLKSLL